ncbi:MAG: dephospho-CoA kinase [Actinomycetota bacterium]
MLVVGLTGGIGAGKSTFAALLAEWGARIIDADVLGHEALRPGEPAWHSVVAQFGDEVLVRGSMEIDRRVLGRVVFDDRSKLAALNAIVHPVIFGAIADELEKLRDTDAVVVLDAALLVETGLDEIVDVVVLLQATEEARERRLSAERGLSYEDIRSRMAAQRDPAEIAELADLIVVNDGSIEDLVPEVERVWKDLLERAQL